METLLKLGLLGKSTQTTYQFCPSLRKKKERSHNSSLSMLAVLTVSVFRSIQLNLRAAQSQVRRESWCEGVLFKTWLFYTLTLSVNLAQTTELSKQPTWNATNDPLLWRTQRARAKIKQLGVSSVIIVPLLTNLWQCLWWFLLLEISLIRPIANLTVTITILVFIPSTHGTAPKMVELWFKFGVITS